MVGRNQRGMNRVPLQRHRGGNIAQLGYTALIHAAEMGHTDCVRLLLEAGANKEVTDSVRQ